MGHPSPKYTVEVKQRAVGLCRELGCDAGSISDWVRRADASGPPPTRTPSRWPRSCAG